MGFLKRIGGGGSGSGKGKVPWWADFMAADEYAEFRRLTDAWLREHAGSFKEIDGGGVEVPTSGKGKQTLGLSNLAQKCHQLPRSEWAAQIDGHFGSIYGKEVSFDDLAFDDVKSMIKVRIFPENFLPPGPPDEGPMVVIRPVAPGLVAVLAIDYPDTVTTLPSDLPEKWGRTPDELFELGLSNVRTQDVPDESAPKGTPMRLLAGDSFFVATWVLMLGERLKPAPENGALVVVPTRHIVLFVPIVDVSIVKSIGPLLGAAEKYCREGPGSISPALYWWKQGKLVLLPSELQGHTVQFAPPDEFTAMLNSLPPER